MKSRIALLVLIIAVIGVLAFFNFPYLAQEVPMSLGITTVQAPLGLILVALTALMAIVFIAYVIAMQGAWLLEARAHSKEMAAQRELADKAEASRFTELRIAIENLHKEEEDNPRLQFHLIINMENNLSAEPRVSNRSSHSEACM